MPRGSGFGEGGGVYVLSSDKTSLCTCKCKTVIQSSLYCKSELDGGLTIHGYITTCILDYYMYISHKGCCMGSFWLDAECELVQLMCPAERFLVVRLQEHL